MSGDSKRRSKPHISLRQAESTQKKRCGPWNLMKLPRLHETSRSLNFWALKQHEPRCVMAGLRGQTFVDGIPIQSAVLLARLLILMLIRRNIDPRLLLVHYCHVPHIRRHSVYDKMLAIHVSFDVHNLQ